VDDCLLELKKCKHDLHGRVMAKLFDCCKVVALHSKLLTMWKSLEYPRPNFVWKMLFYEIFSINDVIKYQPWILKLFAWTNDFNPS
jgi:predicted GNAT superfamily acetyltransferase